MVAPFKSVNKSYRLQRYVPHPRAGYPGNFQVYYEFSRVGTSQKPPYVDTPVRVVVSESISVNTISGPLTSTAEGSVAAIGAANKARAMFVNKLGDSSSFGATLTSELKSTWGTVSGGITSALLAANAVRRGRLGDAARILSFYPPEKTITRSKNRKKLSNGRYRKKLIKTRVWVMPNGRTVSKSLANKWLWYSYGVAPLMQDIRNGMDVLTRPAPSTQVKGSGSAGANSDVGGFYRTRYVYKSRVSVRANVRVKNPNLWLANQLGLINPIQMINEGIRLSFVIDWFSNLSQIINQFTDFVGLEITRPLTVSGHVLECYQFHPDYRFNSHTKNTVITRELSIPQARLQFAYERFSWQRGLNAISLLVGVLKKA